MKTTKAIKKCLSLVMVLVVSAALLFTGFTTTAKKENLVKIEMYYPSPTQGNRDVKKVNDAINKYLQTKINVNLVLNPIDWSAWSTKMPLLYQTGEQVDIAFTASWCNFYTDVAKKGFLPLDDLITKCAPQLKRQMDPSVFQGATVDGHIYAIPTEKEIAGQNALFFRKDLVDKYKFDLKKMKTLNDFEAMFKVIQKNHPNITPAFTGGGDSLDEFGVTNATTFNFENIESNIGMLNKTNKKIVNKYELPETAAEFNLIRKYYLEGYINKDGATTQTKPQDEMKAGKSFINYGSAKPGSEIETENATNVPVYKVAAGKPYMGTDTTTASMLGIPRSSNNPEMAMKVINLLHTDKKLINMLCFGIEGTNYVKVNNNVIDYPNGVTDPNTTGYNPGINWEIGNQFNNYLFRNENPQKWDQYKQWNKAAVKNISLGFVFDPTPVKSEQTALINTIGEFRGILISGSADPTETLKKLNDKLKANGLAKYLAEEQKQFDAWYKARK